MLVLTDLSKLFFKHGTILKEAVHSFNLQPSLHYSALTAVYELSRPLFKSIFCFPLPALWKVFLFSWTPWRLFYTNLIINLSFHLPFSLPLSKLHKETSLGSEMLIFLMIFLWLWICLFFIYHFSHIRFCFICLHACLELLCSPIDWLINMKCLSLSVVMFLILKCTLSNISTGTTGYFWLMFTRSIFLQNFIFKLSLSLYLRCISFWQ